MKRALRRPRGIVLALLVLAGGAWLAIGSTTPPRRRSAGAEDTSATSGHATWDSTLRGAPMPAASTRADSTRIDPGTARTGAMDAGVVPSSVTADASGCRFHVVADASGSPVFDAIVETKGGTRLGKTDAAGMLVATHRFPRAPGASQVLVRHPDFVAEAAAVRPGVPCEVRLTKGFPIRGRVVLGAEDAPVPGARVAAFDTARSWTVDDVTTDLEGRFRIAHARPKTALSLVVRISNRASVALVTVPTAAGEEILLRMPDGGTLTGFVRDEWGRALPQVRVAVLEDGRTLDVSTGEAAPSWERLGADQTFTDADGRYEIVGIPPGTAGVVVAQRSLRTLARSEPFTFEDAGDRIDRDIRVPVPGTLRVSAGSLPFEAEAWVVLAGEGLDATAFDTERLRDGAWEFSDLSPGRYWVSLIAAGYPVRSQEVDVAAGRITPLEIAFRGSLAVEGTVLLPDGRVAVGASIWWTGAIRAFAKTGAEGGFRLGGLDEAPGRLDVVGPDDSPRAARTILEGIHAGGDPLRIVLGFPARVRMRADGLAPLANVSAYVESRRFRQLEQVPMNLDGMLEVEVHDLGSPVRIVWIAEDRSPQLVEVSGLLSGEVRDLGTRRFDAGRTVALRIVDDRDRPVPKARVALLSSWGMHRVAAADADGSVSLRHVPDAAFLVTVAAEDHAPHLLRVPAVVAGPVVLRLEAEGVLDIHVVDRDGKPAAKAFVQLLPAEPDPYDLLPEGLPEGIRADDTGTLMRRAQARAYRVRVIPATREGDTIVGPVVVRAGEATKFEIRLP